MLNVAATDAENKRCDFTNSEIQKRKRSTTSTHVPVMSTPLLEHHHIINDIGWIVWVTAWTAGSSHATGVLSFR